MKLTVTKRFSFEACHYLPRYEGACHNLHGHSYDLEVTVTGEVQGYGVKEGMIIDFKDLKSIVKKHIVDELDHSNLNDTFENPTAEIMAMSIFVLLKKKLKEKGVCLTRVRLWETRDSFAEVTED